MSLPTLFNPKSVALIGASTTPGSVGNDIAKNLMKSDYSGAVYLVNPKAEKLYGVRCYKSIGEIKGTIDLAVIVVPAAIVPTVLREAGEKMVRAAVIISAGFKETGEGGVKLEAEVRAIAEEYHISLLGPNCLGFITPRLFLNASFASASPKAGGIAFLSQSGALLCALLDHAKESLGFSAFVSVGNKAVLGERELLAHFKEDHDTRVIGLYSESLVDAPHFIEMGRALVSGKHPKPVIMLKSGTTEAGTKASSSHTGAVAGSAEVYTALFRQAHMLQAENFEELLELLSAFSKNPLPRGNRVAIVTNAGGFGVLATDAAIQNGLVLAPLSSATQEKLRTVLPPAASVANPVDVLGDALAERYAHALSLVGNDPSVDLLLVILTPQTMTEPEKTARAIAHLRKVKPTLPIVAVFAGQDLVLPGQKKLEHENIAVLGFPESGARALGKLVTVSEWAREKESVKLKTVTAVEHGKVKTLIEQAKKEKRLQLGESAAAEILALYGLPFLESVLVKNADEALAQAKRIGRPVALKIVSPDIIHKSDVGGVLLSVAPEEADQAFLSLMETVKHNAPEAKIEGALIVEMAQTGGLEILLGLKKEPGLGTLLVFGLGGIYVETFHDVTMRFLPMTENDLDTMLQEIKMAPLLAGARGKDDVDMEKLRDCMRRIAQLAHDFPEIDELDVNPLLAFPNGNDFRILDARIKLSE